ncbi:MAG: adenosylmethionine--8-amino-7-oxononanoate transaminase [Alphaproteobacteria bacterium]|nr:adenosylmethionine--8-amino-7-oxononanoate transaminase [Alphaproteobacteria bacterium]
MSEKPIIWHPFTQHGLEGSSIPVARAEGIMIYTQDGREIIDAISSWWVITHGHCHPHIVRAVQAQAAKQDQVIFAGFTHEPAEKLAEKLIKIMDYDLQHVFFSDSGSTAVEVALKMAIGYWVHIGEPRKQIIALEGGYHGDTFGAMSAAGASVYNDLYAPYFFDVHHIPFPQAGHEEETLKALSDFLEQHGKDTAAFIFEPLVQGAAGMRIYSADVLQKMAHMCEAYGVLLIADEVMTGFGRTGTMFACTQAKISPDIVCLSKGLTAGFLPMGTTLCTREIYDAFYHNDKAKMFFHSSSFTGNPLSCAAALASLEIWEKEPVQARIDEIARQHAEAAEEFSANKALQNIRQIGSILAMDLPVYDPGYLAKIQSDLYKNFIEQGVLLRPIGNVIYILPPYCVTKKELQRIYKALQNVIETIAGKT